MARTLSVYMLLIALGVGVGCGRSAPTLDNVVNKATDNVPEGIVERVSGNVWFSPSVNEKQPVTDAVVYINELPLSVAPRAQQDVLVRIDGKHVFPTVSYATVGQTIRIIQSDTNSYNVILTPSRRQPRGEGRNPPLPLSVSFPDSDKVHIRCTIHPEVDGWIVVHDSSQIVRTNERGEYCLPHPLPRGQYQVHAWHPRFGRTDLPIVVRGEEPNRRIDIVFSNKQ